MSAGDQARGQQSGAKKALKAAGGLSHAVAIAGLLCGLYYMGRVIILRLHPPCEETNVFLMGAMAVLSGMSVTFDRRFHVRWGSFGPQFSCADCGVALVSASEPGILEHGDLRITPKRCSRAGKRYRHPFAMMELEEVLSDAKSASPNEPKACPGESR